MRNWCLRSLASCSKRLSSRACCWSSLKSRMPWRSRSASYWRTSVMPMGVKR
nr:MAG TPA: hypothetical protein [Caudoviricetes sp.]